MLGNLDVGEQFGEGIRKSGLLVVGYCWKVGIFLSLRISIVLLSREHREFIGNW